MTRILEPLFFERVLKEKIWGGRNFGSLFDWRLPAERKIGESWEISDVPGEESRVRDGRHAGRTLRDLMERSGPEILGSAAPARGGRFPLLFKFLDTTDLLSVQVHPDGETAERLGEATEGKTEAWYFLSVEPGSLLTAGLRPGADAARLRDAVEHSKVPDLLEQVEVRAGDAVLVPAGLVHALGPGFTLAEVQQTSDITYRLFDWNRLGDDGEPRALHVEKGIQAVDFSFGKPEPRRPRWRRPTRGFREGALVSCRHFRVSLGEVEETVSLRTAGRPVVLMVTEGQGEVAWGVECKAPLDPGDCALVPASLDRFELRRSADIKLQCLLVEPGPF